MKKTAFWVKVYIDLKDTLHRSCCWTNFKLKVRMSEVFTEAAKKLKDTGSADKSPGSGRPWTVVRGVRRGGVFGVSELWRP